MANNYRAPPTFYRCEELQNKKDYRLIEKLLKYATPARRYTYYPPLSKWRDTFDHKSLAHIFTSNYDHEKGVDIYIHIPFCESLCTFCGLNIKITKNHDIENNYIDSLIDEWSFYTDKVTNIKINSLHLGGGTPNFLQAKSLERLLTAIFKNTVSSGQFYGQFEADPRFINIATLKILNQFNISNISYGVQDFNNTVMKNVNRKQSVADVTRAITLADNHNIKNINLDFIYGLPLQTTESVKKSIHIIKDYPVRSVALYPLAVVPWQKKAQEALGKFELPSTKSKYEIYQLFKEMALGSQLHEIGLGHFHHQESPVYLAFKKGALKRNVTGLKPHRTQQLIGLGVSAISTINNHYFQNEKIIEKYQFTIQKDGLSYLSSHHANTLEIVLDNTFEKLLCCHESDLSEYLHMLEDCQEDVGPAQILKNITPLVEDGIVKFENNILSVTAVGISFLKNVFIAIDPYHPL